MLLLSKQFNAHFIFICEHPCQLWTISTLQSKVCTGTVCQRWWAVSSYKHFINC